MKKVFFTAAVICLMVSSCKKEETPPPDNNGNTTDPVNVLNDNSGFAHVYDDLIVLSEVSGSISQPEIKVMDYTLEANNTLNLAYYSAQPTQQDPLYTNKRVSKNLSTNSLVGLPSGADPLSYSRNTLAQQGAKLVLEQFRPYTNFFTYVSSYYPGQGAFNESVKFDGDITGEIPYTPNPFGTPDMGFKYPSLNLTAAAGDNAFGRFTSGIPTPSYAVPTVTPTIVSFYNGTGHPIVASFLESRLVSSNINKAVFVRNDSIIAYAYDNTTAEFSKLSGFPVSGLSGFGTMLSTRHYSTDGTVLGIAVMDATTLQLWTASLDLNTGIITKGLDGVTLDYSGTGTDYDIDEFGNVYYTGYAANGTNTNGVSIYKKTTAGSVSLVGQDNILKFGTVVKLKTLMGKVFIAVTGKKTGTSAYQLSIIKEN